MAALAPGFHSVDHIAGYRKCCWVHYGTERREALWHWISVNCEEFREMQIDASTKSFVERLYDFKIYTNSVLSFIGSVCAPDKATLKDETHALQCTTAGPYNAITSKLLEVGSVCGLGPD